MITSSSPLKAGRPTQRPPVLTEKPAESAARREFAVWEANWGVAWSNGHFLQSIESRAPDLTEKIAGFYIA